MSTVTDQILTDAGVIIPSRLRPQSTEAPPPLPTVGRMVHFYCKNWKRKGPYSAVVSYVEEHSEVGSPVISATVVLLVAGLGHTSIYHDSMETNHPWLEVSDVPGIIPGVDHQHEYWWQWPERT